MAEAIVGGARRASSNPDAGAGTRIRQAGEARSARIESLRALAALSVLLSHAFVYSYGLSPSVTDPFLHRVALEGGLGGVDFFFVLSGYLLFWPFARAGFRTGERVDLRRYALNRAVRILPLYYFVLAVVLVVQHSGGSWGQWWHFGLFLENFSASTLNTVDVPMWSLAVEIQFYLALPLLSLALVAASRGSIARAATMLFALAGVSLWLRETLFWHASAPNFRWQYSLPTLLFFFASGMALALVRLRWQGHPPRWLRGAAAHSSVWMLCSVPLWALVCWKLSFEPAAALASALIIGGCVLPLRRGRLVGLTENRGLSRLGLASYSLYLWQVPVVLAIASGDITARTMPRYIPTTTHFLGLLAVSVAACGAIALISYTVVEVPPLRLRRRWASSLPPAD